jgi:cytochrome P450
MSALPPGPRSPAAWQTAKWIRSPLTLMTSAARDHGDVFTLKIAPFDAVVVVSRPDHVREVFAASPDDVHGGPANVMVRKLFGVGSLLLLDGKEHTRHRKLLMPPFHGERMTAYGEAMLDESLRVIDAMPTTGSFSLLPHLLDLTLEVILRTVFGASGQRLRTLRALFGEVLELLLFPPLLVPALQRDLGSWSPWGRYTRARAQVDRELVQEIRARRESGTSDESVLSLLLAARDEAGAPMTEGEILDELFTLLAAGHETTAAALTWAVRWLSVSPAAVARLDDELASASENGRLSPERVQKLPFLEAVVKETLRLEPLLPLVGRELSRPMRLFGWDLPRGVIVAPAVYLAHRRPETFPEPDAFRPERFLSQKPGPSEWFPFGGGARRCIGAAFSMFEMKIVLATLLTRRRPRLASWRAPKAVRRGITMTPEAGLAVTMERRAR